MKTHVSKGGYIQLDKNWVRIAKKVGKSKSKVTKTLFFKTQKEAREYFDNFVEAKGSEDK